MVNMKNDIYDLIVIGAGAVGLYASFIAQYMKLRVLCIEKDAQYGGQLIKLYPSKPVHDFPGFLSIKAEDIIEQLYQQSYQYNKDFLVTSENIIEYEIDEDNIVTLISSTGHKYFAKYVLFTVGPGAFEHIKVSDEHLDEINHSDINYVFNKDLDVKDKNVVILGGGDSAIDYAMLLQNKYCPRNVTLVHRSEKLRGLSYSTDEIIASGVNLLLNTQVSKINRTHCFFINNDNSIHVPYEYLLVQFGVTSIGSHVHQWNEFERIKNKFVVNEVQQTNLSHFYAAGNCCYKEYKIDMIITGISEATIAVNHIHYLLKKSIKPHY